MKLTVYVAILILVTHASLGQSTISSRQESKPVFRSTSTLVIVPTLVRHVSGTFVANLDESDFRLTDNGIEQKIFVEQMENQPLAVAVLMQTGGEASRQLQNYNKLDIMLEQLLANPVSKVALVTFDSRPEQIWSFPSRTDALYYFVTHAKEGDDGAAIMDAVNCAVDLLQQQPAGFRRIILLLSQAQDDGSKANAEDVVQRLAGSETAVYSLTVSPEETGLKDHTAKGSHGDSLHQASRDNSLLSDAIDRSTSLGIVVKAMRRDTAAEVATLSGGEHLRFQNENDLQHKLSALVGDIHNGYMLSFYPSSHKSGFHIISVQVLKQRTRLEVTTRTSYWFGGTDAEK